MNAGLARAALALYPLAYRRRYGQEMGALLEDSPVTPAVLVDLLGGAVRAHLRPSRRSPRRSGPMSAYASASGRSWSAGSSSRSPVSPSIRRRRTERPKPAASRAPPRGPASVHRGARRRWDAVAVVVGLLGESSRCAASSPSLASRSGMRRRRRRGDGRDRPPSRLAYLVTCGRRPGFAGRTRTGRSAWSAWRRRWRSVGRRCSSSAPRGLGIRRARALTGLTGDDEKGRGVLSSPSKSGPSQSAP